MLLQQMGYDTGIDLRALMAAVALAKKLTGTAPGGRATLWLQGRLDRDLSPFS
jgi:hydroxymethylglutaryl-CoA lyase